MKKLLLLASLIILLGSGFCGSLLMNAMAEDKDGYQPVVFYKSVEISEGDTLWSIAEEYAPDLAGGAAWDEAYGRFLTLLGE